MSSFFIELPPSVFTLYGKDVTNQCGPLLVMMVDEYNTHRLERHREANALNDKVWQEIRLLEELNRDPVAYEAYPGAQLDAMNKLHGQLFRSVRTKDRYSVCYYADRAKIDKAVYSWHDTLDQACCGLTAALERARQVRQKLDNQTT